MMNEVLKAIAERAGQNITRQEGDYEKDGLLHCGKCNTPKQCIVPLGDTFIKPPCMCECRKAEQEAERQAEQREKDARIIERYRIDGIKDEKLLHCTFAKDKQPDNKYSQFAKRYCEQWEKVKAENIGLIFYGDTGRGKSFLAACIANALIDKKVKVIYRTESDILDEIWDAKEKTSYIDRIATVPLLIIDDFGTRRESSYAVEQFKKIIDKRYYSELPTIFTTNLIPDDFDKAKNIDEKRIYERVKAMGQFIEIKGKNWRQEEAAAKATALMGVLSDV